MMVTYTKIIRIEAPPEVVFSVVGDILRMTEIDQGVQKVEIIGEIKEGLGLRTKWTQQYEGKILTWDEEITEWDPPHRYSFTISTPDHRAEGTHILKPIENGSATELTFIETYHYERSKEDAEKLMNHLVERVKRLSEEQTKE